MAHTRSGKQRILPRIDALKINMSDAKNQNKRKETSRNEAVVSKSSKPVLDNSPKIEESDRRTAKADKLTPASPYAQSALRPPLPSRSTQACATYGQTLRFVRDTGSGDEGPTPREQWTTRHRFAANRHWIQTYQMRNHGNCNPFTPESEEWFMENEFRLWLAERNQTIKLQVDFKKKGPYVWSKPKNNTKKVVDQIAGHRDLYEQFNAEKLQREKERQCAVVMQSAVRGWLLRHKIRSLEKEAAAYHGQSLHDLVREYKGLVKRIQQRTGHARPSVKVDLDQVKKYMDKKQDYERAFRQSAEGSTLELDQVADFFKHCGLQPTEREIQNALKTIFKGCGSSSEVVILVDSSFNTKSSLLQKKFVKALVEKLEVSPQNSRVSVVPYHSSHSRTLSLQHYTSKETVLRDFDGMILESGSEGIETALQVTRDILVHAREAVPKNCIVIHNDETKIGEHFQTEVALIRNTGITLSTVGMVKGCVKDEVLDLATSSDHIFCVRNYYNLEIVTKEVFKKLVFAGCTSCLNKTADDPFHFRRYDPHTQTMCDQQTRTAPSKSTRVLQSDVIKERITEGSKCRGLTKHETLELLWMIYPPEATGIHPMHRSTWMRPCVDGNELAAVKEEEFDAAFDKCLKLVLQSKLDRQECVTMPVGDSDVTDVRDYDTAYRHARDYIKRQRLQEDQFYQRQSMVDIAMQITKFKAHFKTPRLTLKLV